MKEQLEPQRTITDFKTVLVLVIQQKASVRRLIDTYDFELYTVFPVLIHCIFSIFI